MLCSSQLFDDVECDRDEEDREKADDAGVKDFFVAGMVTPKEVVARVLSLFSLVKYNLKLNIIFNYL